VKFLDDLILATPVNSDISDRLNAFNKNFPLQQTFKIILTIEEAEKMFWQNVNPEMILLDLSFKLRTLLK
jgi:hypothetical protein